MMQTPIEQCYWVVPGQLIAGEYPRNLDDESSTEKIDALVNAGVTSFIDLTEESELKPYSHLINPDGSNGNSHQRFPIADVSVPESRETTIAVLDAIDVNIASGKLVYLHCWGGIGRTGLIVGCWLARSGLHGQSALERLQDLWQQCPKSARSKSPESAEQEAYILEWREDV